AELLSRSANLAFEKRYGLKVIQSMGMVETLAHSLNSSADFKKLGSAGTPMCGARIEIRDEDSRPLGCGEVGEIVIDTPLLMKRYMGSSPKNKLFRTGDLGYIDSDGFLWFLARKSAALDIAALKDLPKVNDAISGITDVAEFAVVGAQGSRLVAFVCLKADSNKDRVLNEILDSVSRAGNSSDGSGLDELQVEFIDEIPELPSGKYDIKALENLAARLLP
ncbi:MAG: AMP-binding protein, partial [Candidatus Obscuribacterales bacterium]|nr:AMP-binding protein [Candidatus Obscuribacterales bacterium]